MAVSLGFPIKVKVLMSYRAENLVAVFLTTLSLSGQQAGTLTISVVNSAGSLPVSGAKTSLTWIEPGSSDSKQLVCTTDAMGQCRFAGLGNGTATVEKRGFMKAESVRFTFSLPQGPPSNLEVALTPLATVQGRILDSNAEPIAGAQIGVAPPRRPEILKTTSDEQGRFKITDLEPGRYYLVAHPKGDAFRLTSTNSEAAGWSTAMFPSAAEREVASSIDVRAGAELYGYDIYVAPKPLAKVAGRLLDDEGHPVEGASILIRPEDPNERFSMTAPVDAKGAFTFPAVPAGSWQVAGLAHRADVVLKAFAPLKISNSDDHDISITLSPPFDLLGKVQYAEMDIASDHKLSAVYLVPVNAQGEQVATFHRKNGDFTLKGVYPGTYRIAPAGSHKGFYLDSVVFGTVDVVGKPVAVDRGSPAITITYRTRGASVAGTVKDGLRASIVLIPEDDSFLSLQMCYRGEAEAGAAFTIGPIHPGRYRAFAFDKIDLDALEDISFVHRIRSSGTPVDARVGDTIRVALGRQKWTD
jgi:hypothetical protein